VGNDCRCRLSCWLGHDRLWQVHLVELLLLLLMRKRIVKNALLSRWTV
jgi:hypothetical protein